MHFSHVRSQYGIHTRASKRERGASLQLTIETPFNGSLLATSQAIFHRRPKEEDETPGRRRTTKDWLFGAFQFFAIFNKEVTTSNFRAPPFPATRSSNLIQQPRET
jgi:hypothetical protein